MSKPLVLVLPHELGIEEARRRLDGRTEWALRKLRDHRIQIDVAEWHGNERSFAATTLGQKISGLVSVAEDCVRLEANLPLPLRPFSPAIEALAKKYAGPLFAPAAA